MIGKNYEHVKPFCKYYWKGFKRSLENTELAKSVLDKETPNGKPVFVNTNYRRQRLFYIPNCGEIVAKVLAGENNKRGIYVELLLEKQDKTANEVMFNCLKEDKKIETDLGLALGWEKLGLSLDWAEGLETKRSNILVGNRCNPRDETDWKRQHDWLIKTATEFNRVFTHRLEKIKL